jgi:hypothetical protein
MITAVHTLVHSDDMLIFEPKHAVAYHLEGSQ